MVIRFYDADSAEDLGERDGADVTREQTTTPADVFLTDEMIDNYVDPNWDGKS